MKQTALFLLLAASVAAASAQAPSKPATKATKPATAAHSTSTSAKPAAKLPPIHGVKKTMLSLQYVDYKIGTGTLGEPNKVYHVLYTGYLASTGQVFDSSDKHRTPMMKDGKPVMDKEGNPQMGAPQPLVFPQGYGRMIPGMDLGVVGMRVGGKRRIFVPWQLGFGTRDIPAHGTDFLGIPSKSDLIFDVELLDVTDMPKPPTRPMGMPPHPPMPPHPTVPAKPATPAAPSTPPASTTPATPPAAAAPAKPATPAPGTSTPPASSTNPPSKNN